MPKVGMEPIRRDQIRRAAAKVFAKRGFEGTTLMEIAKAAGVSTGTINHYYDNKLAVLVDTIVYVSEWFQTRVRAAIEDAQSSEDKIRALVRVGMFGSGVGSGAGQEIWIWAFAESIRFKPLRAVIEERRRLFVQIIFGVLRELELARDMRESELVKLALECDAYITGLYVQLATGARPMDHAVAELTLLSMTIGRAATKAVLQRPAAARASKRPATRRSKAA